MGEPFRWTERRVARLVTIIVTALVVVFALILFIIVRLRGDAFPPPWGRNLSLAAGGILLFALWRLRRQIRFFRQDR
jgi:hypothetical protein